MARSAKCRRQSRSSESPIAWDAGLLRSSSAGVPGTSFGRLVGVLWRTCQHSSLTGHPGKSIGTVSDLAARSFILGTQVSVQMPRKADNMTTTSPASAARMAKERQQTKDATGPEPRFPKKLHTDAQVLAAVKWTIRSLAREEIAPDTARALVDSLEKLSKMKRVLKSFDDDDRDEDAELLALVDKRMAQ